MSKFTLFLVLFALLSCEGDIDLGFRWNGMTPHNASNASEFPEVFNGDSLPASNYCIQLDMHMEELYRNGRYLDTETPPYNSNELVELEITSNSDFDAAHPAGTNLTSFFTILNGSYYHMIPADGSEGYEITNIYSHYFLEQPAVAVIDLLLTKTPILNNTHIFNVKCTLEDSTIYQGNTNPIKIY